MTLTPAQAMTPEWINRRSNYGKVFTTYSDRPNGWSACVTDDTELSAPFRGTRYHVQANCRFWGISHPSTFTMLKDARAAALAFTDRMPRCDPDAMNGDHCRGAWDVRDEAIKQYQDAQKAGKQ